MFNKKKVKPVFKGNIFLDKACIICITESKTWYCPSGRDMRGLYWNQAEGNTSNVRTCAEGFKGKVTFIVDICFLYSTIHPI